MAKLTIAKISLEDYTELVSKNAIDMHTIYCVDNGSLYIGGNTYGGIDEFEEYDSYLNFPVIGDAEKHYIDKTENKIYRWDNTDLKYFCIGSDYSNISIIDGSEN